MKEYISFRRPKYRYNELLLNNGSFIVKHIYKIKVSNIDIKELYSDEYNNNHKNKIISELFDIDRGYCNEYLKNQLKTAKKKSKKNILAYNELNQKLKKDLEIYNAIYSETELSNILLKFGKKINTIVKIDVNKIYGNNDNIENLCDEIKGQLFDIIYLNKKNISKLEKAINDLVYQIGVPCKINKENYSKWDNVIFVCLLSYLYKESVNNKLNIKFNILVLLKYYLSILNNKIQKVDYEIIEFNKDKKEVKIIKSIIPFIIFYLENNYYYKEYIEFWQSDHQGDVLEDFRQELLLKCKDINKRKKIELYSYDELDKKYRRKKFNY